MRPDLEALVAEHHADHSPEELARATGQVGQLAVAESLDRRHRRVVLVTGTEETVKTLNILLASNRTEMATDLDAIVGREASSASYDLLLQGELYGPIFAEQLDGLVGSITPDAARALARALDTDGASLEGFDVGLPLGGIDDPRRSFKDEELEDLMRLVASCRRWLAGGRAETTSLDPEVLFPPPRGTSFDEAYEVIEELLALLDQLESGGHHVSVDVWSLLDDDSFAELQRWRTDYGIDIWARLQRLALGDAEREAPEAVSRDELRETYVASYAASGAPVLDLLTRQATAWNEPLVEELSGGVCRSRALVGVGR